MKKTSLLVIFSLLSLILNIYSARGAKGTSVKSGNWNNASTWLINGVNRVPTCGDTITIDKGDTITVNTQESLTGCSSPLYIIVDTTAVFQFTNGNKLDLPCGSTVEVYYNGVLKKATAGGGNSTLISICDTTQWKAGDGTIVGYIKFQAGNTLPVSWLGMNAVVNGSHVDVYWSTATEINNNYFTVEKSKDGINFTAVGEIAGAGNSTSVHNYMLSDLQPYQGISYYRVKQTDYDGKFEYSRMQAVNFSIKGDVIRFFPNPVTDKLFIAVSTAEESAFTIRVFDTKGAEAFATIVYAAQKSNLIPVDFSMLQSGIYTVQVISEKEINYAKLVKE